MIKWLLDTSICIEIIRNRSHRVLAELQSCEPGAVGISSVTLAELYYGAARSSDPVRNRLMLTQFCAPLETMPFDDHAASEYGQVRANLERSGLPVGPLDTLIAAHALSLRTTLVTNNEREFRRMKGLRVENWARG